MLPRVGTWQPTRHAMQRVDSLIQEYREEVIRCLEPLVRAYYPALFEAPDNEYLKMVELTTKMTLVGSACTQLAGETYDRRRLTLGNLYGGCCFLADSFIDDFGEAKTKEYLERFEVLLTEGWFEIKNDREQLFYVIVSRMFGERDIFDSTLRQAILRLFEAQKRDVQLRPRESPFRALPRRNQLEMLRQCARDRGGQTSTVLSQFLMRDLDLFFLHPIFVAGGLFMYIDDHGDHYSDRQHDRVTYLNQVKDPERTLKRIFLNDIQRLFDSLPENAGRELLVAFLTRYYLTRIEKHRLQRSRARSWEVYE